MIERLPGRFNPQASDFAKLIAGKKLKKLLTFSRKKIIFVCLQNFQKTSN